MSRELRRVPPDWKHPRGDNGRHKPLHDRSYREAAEEWVSEFREFAPNEHCSYYWEWSGNPPSEEDYRPGWPEESRTHFQMYETCSEGTPISPVLGSPEDVARWCADNGASVFGSCTTDYEGWMRICEQKAFGLLVIDTDRGIMAPDTEYGREVQS